MMNRPVSIVPLLLIHTVSAFIPRSVPRISISTQSTSKISKHVNKLWLTSSTMSSITRKRKHTDDDCTLQLLSDSKHGGIPIGAVRLPSSHVQNFKTLIAKQLSIKADQIYRGVEPYNTQINEAKDELQQQEEKQLLIHLSPIVATSLDDDNPILLDYLQTNNGVYMPGVRRPRDHRAATRKKKNATKELSSSSYGIAALPKDSGSRSSVDSNTATSSTSFTFGELFAGIGGFRLGLEAIGGKCIFANEMNPYAAAIYRHHFETTSAAATQSAASSDCCSLIEADILDVYTHEISKDIDILTGGFPCQPFSSRGSQGGFNDERGQLYREIVRVLKGSTPKSFILENVVGLISMGEEVGKQKEKGEVGSVFATILKAFEECGYDVSWKLINSRHYVPQNRERVYIVGIRNDLVDKDDTNKWNWDWYDKILDGSSTEHETDTTIVRDIMESSDSPSVKEAVMTSQQWSKLKDIHSKRNGIGYAYINPNQKAPTLISSYKRTGNHTSKFIGTERDGTKNDIPRFLTPRECLRIMGFGEDFYAPSISNDGNDATAHFYSGIGNAVVPQVISSIGKELIKCLQP